MKRKAIVAALAAVLAVAAVAWCQDAMPQLHVTFCLRDTICLSGQAKLTNGQAVITLPAWFEGKTLTTDRTVQLTCKDGWSKLWTSGVAGGQFTVSTNSEGNSSQAFYWEVKAPRKH